MTTFIVNTGQNKEVHRTAHAIPACNIQDITSNNRLDTSIDYTELYPKEYDGCKHCYNDKHWK